MMIWPGDSLWGGIYTAKEVTPALMRVVTTPSLLASSRPMNQRYAKFFCIASQALMCSQVNKLMVVSNLRNGFCQTHEAVVIVCEKQCKYSETSSAGPPSKHPKCCFLWNSFRLLAVLDNVMNIMCCDSVRLVFAGRHFCYCCV